MEKSILNIIQVIFGDLSLEVSKKVEERVNKFFFYWRNKIIKNFKLINKKVLLKGWEKNKFRV